MLKCRPAHPKLSQCWCLRPTNRNSKTSPIGHRISHRSLLQSVPISVKISKRWKWHKKGEWWYFDKNLKIIYFKVFSLISVNFSNKRTPKKSPPNDSGSGAVPLYCVPSHSFSADCFLQTICRAFSVPIRPSAQMKSNKPPALSNEPE